LRRLWRVARFSATDGATAGSGLDEERKKNNESERVASLASQTERLVRLDIENGQVDPNNVQVLLTEYAAVLAETQAKNARLRALLGDYDKTRFGRENLPASRVIEHLTKRLNKFSAVATQLRGALENGSVLENDTFKDALGDSADVEPPARNR
jgi:hypothetical protein